ncbi:MAG: NADH-quinone oxidoreductase subunit J [Ardenticatenaceae bacterium]|nr:NADH-quinone oxidoreductase subunit J [Ardenticatenaceae bacterium]MCB8987913.1 NADH-quinone oxidoreductase subunit J [Ardenticatenaceae bacterium]
MVEQIVFLIISAFTLTMAVIVVTKRNLFHAALALMASFLGVAGLYVTLDAGFLAAAQLLVYIGAISILVIFAIMMTRRLMQTSEPAFNTQAGFALLTAVIGFGVVFWVFYVFRNIWPLVPDTAVPLASKPVVPQEVLQNSVALMGRAFVNPAGYVLPFEIASVLLLAALVGAIIVAWPKAEDKA